jgi:hypothetical protein
VASPIQSRPAQSHWQRGGDCLVGRMVFHLTGEDCLDVAVAEEYFVAFVEGQLRQTPLFSYPAAKRRRTAPFGRGPGECRRPRSRGPGGPPIHPCLGGPDEEVAGRRSSAPVQKRSPTPRGSRSACGRLSTCPSLVDIGNLNRARELT